MNRVVVIRVGEPTVWNSLHSTGRWASPENYSQAVRNLFVEGYSVIAIFVGRGDLPLAACRITNVRERLMEDGMFPPQSDIGPLRTFLEFDPRLIMNLENGFLVSHHSIIQYIRYKVGYQIAIPQHVEREFLAYYLIMTSPNGLPYIGNTTYAVSNLNPQNPINFII